MFKQNILGLTGCFLVYTPARNCSTLIICKQNTVSYMGCPENFVIKFRHGIILYLHALITLLKS